VLRAQPPQAQHQVPWPSARFFCTERSHQVMEMTTFSTSFLGFEVVTSKARFWGFEVVTSKARFWGFEVVTSKARFWGFEVVAFIDKSDCPGPCSKWSLSLVFLGRSDHLERPFLGGVEVVT
jgi:hypothetical protein